MIENEQAEEYLPPPNNSPDVSKGSHVVVHNIRAFGNATTAPLRTKKLLFTLNTTFGLSDITTLVMAAEVLPKIKQPSDPYTLNNSATEVVKVANTKVGSIRVTLVGIGNGNNRFYEIDFIQSSSP